MLIDPLTRPPSAENKVKISARDNGRLLNPVSCQSSKEIRLPRLCSTSVVVRPADAAQRAGRVALSSFLVRHFSPFSLSLSLSASVITVSVALCSCYTSSSTATKIPVPQRHENGDSSSSSSALADAAVAADAACTPEEIYCYTQYNSIQLQSAIPSSNLRLSTSQSSHAAMGINHIDVSRTTPLCASSFGHFLSVDQLIDPPPSSSARPQMATLAPAFV